MLCVGVLILEVLQVKTYKNKQKGVSDNGLMKGRAATEAGKGAQDSLLQVLFSVRSLNVSLLTLLQLMKSATK